MPVRTPSPADLEPIERASQDELRALQLQRLKWSVRHAYDNVPHYRAKFAAHGAHPDDLKSLDDLGKFPFTTKQDLRDNYPFGMFAVPREQVVRVHASSGTTGKPTVVGYTRKDIDTWADLVARSIRASGGRAGDIVHVAYGYGLFTGGLGAHYGAERLGCTVIPMSGGQTEKQVQLIQDFRPDHHHGDALLHAGADRRDGHGRASTRSSARSRSASSARSPGPTPCARRSSKRAGLDAVDIYGLSEVMGPGVANECIETKDGPVVWEDHFYPEIIDPADRQGAARRLARRTGIHLADQRGAAGHPLPHPRSHPPAAAHRALHAAHRQDHRPLGRHADHPRRQRVPVPDRRADLQDAGARAALSADRRTRKATSTRLTVRVELRPELRYADRDTVARELQHHIKSYIGVSSRIEVVAPSPSSG